MMTGRSDPSRSAAFDADVLRQFAALGVDTRAFAPHAGDGEAEISCEVWDINWRATEAFLACQTQWRAVGTMGAPFWIGLDYGGVAAVMKARRTRAAAEVFTDLQTMEAAALAILNDGGAA